jgi:AcrR family transcriptional regulator
MEKMNIRARFTQKALQDSLLTLMKEKSVLDISVKEICGLAGISRSTFYAYYKNQYDLLRKIEEQTFIDIAKIAEPHIKAQGEEDRRQAADAGMRELLQYIADNSNSIQILLSENGDRGFQKKILRITIEYLREFTEAAGVESRNKKMAKYDFIFLTGGALTLVQAWLKNGMDAPVPEMSKALTGIMLDTLGGGGGDGQLPTENRRGRTRYAAEADRRRRVAEGSRNRFSKQHLADGDRDGRGKINLARLSGKDRAGSGQYKRKIGSLQGKAPQTPGGICLAECAGVIA